MKYEENRCINFFDFKKLLHRWINILTTRKTLCPPRREVETDPNSSNSRTMVNNGHAINCGICDASHITDACPILLSLAPDERVGKL